MTFNQQKMLVAALVGLLITTGAFAQDFLVGTGIYDMTGPVTQVNLMGYANPSQTGLGLQSRLWARAFIFVDRITGERAVFVNMDIAFSTQIVKTAVIDRLRETYGALYTEKNVGLSGTHSHSGPAGYSEYVLFEVTSLGFIYDNFDAIVEGIYQSIVNAHTNIRAAFIYANVGELLNTSINRSPAAYDNNPAEEKARYKYNTDKDMTLIKIVDTTGQDLGSINWFAVHCVSMNNSNRLISSDNKGHAEYLLEKDFGTLNGKGTFVGAFATANEGDSSPNTGGPFCTDGPDKGLPCDYLTSTCPNENGLKKTQLCNNIGPAGSNDRENNRIIGENQYKKAKELYDTATQPITGRVYVRHAYVDMPNLIVTLADGSTTQLCKPSMGFAFGGGTTDGPGFLNFYQGDTSITHPFWDAVRDFLAEPTPELLACHAPKPILLPTGEVRFPHAWQPTTIEVQIFVIGDLAIVLVPGEFTTMSGRRVREAVRKILVDGGILSANGLVVISGLANTYADYVTTFEEYQIQRYEGGSTIYGPHTLEGYIQEFSRLATSIARNTTIPSGTPPVDLSDRLISRAPLPKEDLQQNGTRFGAIKRDVPLTYRAGETASVLFYGANPRNNLMTGSTYFVIETIVQGIWTVVRTDNDYDTELRWIPLHEDRAEQFISDIEIVWYIPESEPRGEYRIRYFGYSRSADETTTPFEAVSSVFRLQ